MSQEERPISSLSGPELLDYMNILSQRQSEFSKLKLNLTEQLVPIDQARAAKRAEIQAVTERMKQVKTEIAACKYAIKAESN